jgi:hypothetical protein
LVLATHLDGLTVSGLNAQVVQDSRPAAGEGGMLGDTVLCA